MYNNFNYLVSYFISVGGAIDNLWNIFMGIHILLFASIYKLGRKLKISERIFMAIAYVCFGFMNFRAIVVQYSMLSALKNDILLDISSNIERNSNMNLIKFFGEYGYSDRINITIAIHATAAFAVLTYLFISKRKITESQTNKSNSS